MSRNAPRIIFITSTNLASNPRCRKEMELAARLGYNITVLAFDMPNWTRPVEEQIKKSLGNIEYFSLQTARHPLLPWLMNSLAGKAARVLYRLGWQSLRMSAGATDKRSFAIVHALRQKNITGHLIIAHNPGAFYPAYWLSRKTGVPFGIDVEDFHPGENNAPVVRASVKKLMQAVIPAAAYASFAAPLIQKATAALLESPMKDAVVINNVFPKAEFPEPGSSTGNEDKLKLVWFSQHISFGRGLEDILPVLELYADRLQLTLIGNLDKQFKEAVLDKYSYITIKEPVSQELLNAQLCEHDIGLAIESTQADQNRQICLTNKIWAYLQAGLYIVANNTAAQMEFANTFPAHTAVIDLNNTDKATAVIKNMIDTLPALRQNKRTRWQINEQVNWEAEQQQLAGRWKLLLNK